MSKDGLLIVFEGIDGSGKSTQARLLCEELREMGFYVLQTKEPSQGIIGNLIHEHAEQGDSRMPKEVEALLFAADRFEHTRCVIEPALSKGQMVVSDRYLHSSLAYQGAEGLSIDWIRELNRFALKPDLGILLDLSVESVFQRIGHRKKTVFEEKSYLDKVRDLYLQFHKSGELVKVDADRTIDEVKKDVISLVEGPLHNRR